MKINIHYLFGSFISGIGALLLSNNIVLANPILETKPAKIEQADLSFKDLVGDNPKLELIGTGYIWSEGPQAMPDGSVIWSDVISNKLYRWDDRNGVQIWLSPSQHQNGHTLDNEGRLLAASHGKRAIERLEKDGKWHVLVDVYQKQKFNSPNDLIVDKEGNIWFTDPDYGIRNAQEGYGGRIVQDDKAVYIYNPKTEKVTRLNSRLVRVPNGLAFSPDGKKLYIADSEQTYNYSNKLLNHQIIVYDINPDKSLANGKIFAIIDPGAPDGIRVDEKGDVWSSSKTGIQVFSPQGKNLGEIIFPGVTSNLSFGIDKKMNKPVIYVTADQDVYRIYVNVKGANTP